MLHTTMRVWITQWTITFTQNKKCVILCQDWKALMFCYLDLVLSKKLKSL